MDPSRRHYSSGMENGAAVNRSSGPRWIRAFVVVVLVVSAAGWGATEFLNSATPTGSAPRPYATQDTTPCDPEADALCAGPTESCADLVARYRQAPSPDPDPGTLVAVLCSSDG
jgi:hypothetical protein